MAAPKNLAAKLANPGERAKLPERYLTRGQRAQRRLNKRLDQPIMAGSAITNRMLARQRNAATTAQFAPAEQAVGQEIQAATQHAGNVGDWYDRYLAELGGHQQRVARQSDQTNAAMGALLGAVQGLGQQQAAAGQQGVGRALEGTGATPSPDGAQVSTDASAVRQAMLAALASGLAGQGRASADYAGTLASVVGPGQKITAGQETARGVKEAIGRRTALQAQKGAAGAQYEAGVRESEGKNILAQRIAMGEQAFKASQSAADRASRESIAAGRNATSRANARERGAAKARTKDQTFKDRYGVNPATGVQVRGARTGIGKASSTLNQILAIKSGQPVDPAKPDGEKYDFTGRDLGYRRLVQTLVGQGIDQVWANVAADQYWYRNMGGGITPGSARALHSAGFTAKQLGLKVRGKSVRGPATLPKDKK